MSCASARATRRAPCRSRRSARRAGGPRPARARSRSSPRSTRTTCRCAPPTPTRRASTSTAPPRSCGPKATSRRRASSTSTHRSRRRSRARASPRRYAADSYEELVDHPVEIGRFDLTSFEAGGVTHDVAIAGARDVDLDRVARDLARVCQWHCDLFAGAPNGRAPFDRYLFLVLAVGDGYGGLEHRASTSLVCKRDELPRIGDPGLDDGYVTFLGLASHEYFHAWNVKRIKPSAFTPYDLSQEGFTRLLWAFEGITSYYDDLSLARSGVAPAERVLELLARTLTTVLRTPGRHLQSVADASFDAWIKFYRPDENSPNAGVSYYAKGAIVALALDLTLRRHGRSLDDLMRALWTRHGATGVGVDEDAIEALASSLAGHDLRDFFARYVDGTEDPPLAALL